MISVFEDNREPETLVDECEALLRSERAFFETDPYFERHPMVPEPGSIEFQLFAVLIEESQPVIRLADQFVLWQEFCERRVQRFSDNVEALNRTEIEEGGLRSRVTRILEEEHAISLADPGRDVRSLISYAVGCMFGRYSVDVPGLIDTGDDWNASRYIIFIPDVDGILPICDEAYFPNDIVTLFVNWLEVVFGTVTLEENLAFVAEALGGIGAPREVIRRYFLKDFYRDHLAVYGDRPIYLLFDSGQEHAFKCLVYVYRWKQDTVARVCDKYVRVAQDHIDARFKDPRHGMDDSAAMKAKADELQAYSDKLRGCEDIAIRIDPDGDATAAYARLADVLAPIR